METNYNIRSGDCGRTQVRECASGCALIRCYNIVLAVVGALFALAVGLIIGITAVETFAPYLTTIIAVAVLLAVLVVVFIILRFCKRC